MRRTMVAAHTGCGIYPDNTMASFLEGMQLGADIVEVDVRAASDGTAVLLHDDSPYLHTHSYEQVNDPAIRTLIDPAYADHEIAALEQALRVSEPHGTMLNLDVKTASGIDPAIRLIRQYEVQKRAFITGCSDGITDRYPDIQVMMNTPDMLTMDQMEHYGEFAANLCNEALQGGYVGLNMNGFTCLPPIVSRAHSAGLKVWVYTVNDRALMQWFLAMGVDAITTRAPQLLMSLLEE
ncbi:glycerophosphodiester phosphodiesterase [Paenibacillus sp. LHD-117]|uniref:glycerophosphodiester phosphodiesterase n=1 Tax=Paenibacillus sp. LHD-117 TaxID=3071412 RepID=UPI0027E1E9B5|nr:glycerophosphodiester phosphodiesterase [Paenibacillus sp. LHD-117]MDQ6422301.1 glycerophosphodiester phosphodiesterase [Paenibacillus sp. LHD-117]